MMEKKSPLKRIFYFYFHEIIKILHKVKSENSPSYIISSYITLIYFILYDDVISRMISVSSFYTLSEFLYFTLMDKKNQTHTHRKS